jgi:chromosomal replication initiation ATPase DnaA
MTARKPPSAWVSEIPDLRSRLNALPVAQLYEPDDAVLTGVLAKFFQERNIRPSEDLLSYLVRRIERSAPRARDIVAKIDETAARHSRAVSRGLAREILDGETQQEDFHP